MMTTHYIFINGQPINSSIELHKKRLLEVCVCGGGGGGREMKDEIKVSLPLFSLLYNPAILFEVHQEPQQPKILTPAERTAERIINKRRLQ